MKECKCCNSCVDENETICPVCGRALYDNTKSLPKDDENKLQHMNTEELSDDDLKISFTDVVSYFNNHRKGVFIGFISILAIIIVFIASSFISTVCKYNKAEEALTNSLYDEAIELYESISNYKDSDEKLHEAKYRKAENALNHSMYDEAIELYESISNYKDSDEKLQESEYQKANSLIQSKKYDEAISLYGYLGSYKDSAEILKKYKYVKIKETTSYANGSTKKSEYSYNETGNLKTIYRDGNVTNYEYDTNGNLIKKTSSSKQQHIFITIIF